MSNNKLASEFTFPKLFLFSLPSIIMMIFMSLYTIVDGFFISRYVGADALSSTNIVYPLSSTILAIGVMFASGGSAIVARQMGEGHPKDANRSFTLFTISALVLGTVFSAVCLIFMDPILEFLGARGSLIQPSREYLGILLLFSIPFILQILFQTFFVTAGWPKLGLILTVLGGFANMFFDYFLIVVCHMGIRGAAIGTAMSYCIPAVGGLIFFFCNRKGLHFTVPSRSMALVLESCSNGSSEMVTNLSASVTTLLFNLAMLKLAGPDGVAAITAVLYFQFSMTSFYIGFSMGVAPVVSYHFGAQNTPFLRKTLKNCILFILAISVFIFIASIAVSDMTSAIFFPDAPHVRELAAHGLRLFSSSFLFAGINIFGSAFFTALGNGKTSATISFSRTFFFTTVGIIAMAYLWGLDGLWMAVPFAELVTALFVVWLSKSLKNDYGLL